MFKNVMSKKMYPVNQKKTVVIEKLLVQIWGNWINVKADIIVNLSNIYPLVNNLNFFFVHKLIILFRHQ